MPFWYGAVAAVLAFTGPGPWSLDTALGLYRPSGWAWGPAASAVGVLASAVPPAARARVLHERARAANGSGDGRASAA